MYFYEIGFAHALGKTTILFAKSTEDLKAFDTQGFRHFLHDGMAIKVREILQKVLSKISSENRWPLAPSGKIIYEWPSCNANPEFRWNSHSPEKNSQMDVNGGQSIITCNTVGRIIEVANTEEYWNWYPGYSIMSLLDRNNQESGKDKQ